MIFRFQNLHSVWGFSTQPCLIKTRFCTCQALCGLSKLSFAHRWVHRSHWKSKGVRQILAKSHRISTAINIIVRGLSSLSPLNKLSFGSCQNPSWKSSGIIPVIHCMVIQCALIRSAILHTGHPPGRYDLPEMKWSQYHPGWWLSLPLWKIWGLVNWDDDIPNWMETSSSHLPVTTNQVRSTKFTRWYLWTISHTSVARITSRGWPRGSLIFPRKSWGSNECVIESSMVQKPTNENMAGLNHLASSYHPNKTHIQTNPFGT